MMSQSSRQRIESMDENLIGNKGSMVGSLAGGDGLPLGEPMIDLNDPMDQAMLKNLYNVVRAYQIVMVPESRDTYLKQIRLRSFASQYMNLHAAGKDGYIYPFLLFSVQENN